MKYYSPFNVVVYFIINILTIFSSSTVSAEAWHLEKDQAGITVYTRAVQGSDIREIKGEIILKSSLASVLAVFDDINNIPQWNHQCTQATLLKRVNLYERYHYQNISLPFPVKDRHLILYSKVIPSKNKITIYSKAAPDFCKNASLKQCIKIKQSNNVQIISAQGKHEFISQEDGTIKVIWQQHIDPAGKIPTFLVNQLLVDVPYYTLQKLQQQVRLAKYKNATLDDFLPKK
jgi:hypothetical protein